MSEALAIVHEVAADHGFEVVGVTSAAPLEDALTALRSWWDAGHGADLDYMGRNPPERADPRTLLKTVRSVISVAVNYWTPAAPFEHEGRYGRVARYAWGLDYHDVVIPRLKQMGAALVDRLPGAGKARAASDYSPFLERAAAARSGVGFFGKNTCLLLPRRGSWYFLGELLLDVELPGTEREGSDHCGTCTDCLPACPTDAFTGPYQLDARRCISYLTIEEKGFLPRELRAGLGAWIFGCDVCQEVCPFNRFAAPAPWPEFSAEYGVGPRLDLAEILGIGDDDTFKRRFESTPLLRTRRRGLLRNAAVVARNIDAQDLVPLLERRAREDPEPVIRAHALWALAGLDASCAKRVRAALVDKDPDPDVRAEAAAV